MRARSLEFLNQPNHTNKQWQPDDEGFKATAEIGQIYNLKLIVGLSFLLFDGRGLVRKCV